MNKKFWTELWYFLLTLMFGILIVALLTYGLTCAYPFLINTVVYYHIIQWMQTIFVMIVPAMLWCRWRTYEPYSQVLNTHFTPSWKQYGIVAILTLVCLPLIDLLAEGCQSIPLPDALKTIAEEEAETQEILLQKMLEVKGIGGWFELVLLMSIATAIGEEISFRGLLLTILRRYTRLNKHVIAILVGLIFSIVHFDIYGLVPRWILGSAFVYVVYYTGSIWPSVLAHALNNLFALLQYKGIIG